VSQSTQKSTSASPPRTVHDICDFVKRDALEVAITIVFLAWVVKEVWHALGLPQIPWDQLMGLFK